MTATHICMRCGERFECPTPLYCTAGESVLPRIVIDSSGTVVDYCFNTPRGRLDYKGFTGLATYDHSIPGYHGRVEHIQDVVTFEAATIDDVEREFHASVDDYLEMLSQTRRATPPKQEG
jgi:hypothetical protein